MGGPIRILSSLENVKCGLVCVCYNCVGRSVPKTFLNTHVKYVDIKYKSLDKYDKRRQVPSSIVQ